MNKSAVPALHALGAPELILIVLQCFQDEQHVSTGLTTLHPALLVHSIHTIHLVCLHSTCSARRLTVITLLTVLAQCIHSIYSILVCLQI